MSELWDDPNRQAVGLDPAWVEGTGGSPEGEPTPQAAAPATKAQLLEQAHDLGLDVDDTNTKAEIQAAIDEAG